ncbi:MAG: Hsp20/alpha crystallin family protein [Desulfobacterales bacterium]|jgi:HSP20 family protein
MTKAKWDPFCNLGTLQDRINTLFEESFGCSPADEACEICVWQPVVDIVETASGFLLRAEIPGVDKADLVVEVRDNVLTLRGERKAEGEFPEESYLRRERCFGPFQRAFTLPSPVAPEQIKATIKNGVLEISLPRPQADTPRHITIDLG